MLSTFTVKKNDGTTDVVYTLQGNSTTEASYIDTTSSLSAPRKAIVSHQLKPTGSQGSDRHQVLFQSVVLDANNVPHTISVNMMLTVPRATVATDTLVLDAIAATVNYLGLSGIRAALIDGIIP